MNSPNFSTLAACRDYLTGQGYQVVARNTAEGRRYLVVNFRGGVCFHGTRHELAAELAAGWLRYA